MPNERLRAHRLRRGWSLDDLANEIVQVGASIGEDGLGVTGNTVGRWERGERRPRAPYPKILCAIFGASAEDLDLRATRPSLDRSECDTLDDDVKRRAVLQLMGGAVTAGALMPARRLKPSDPEADTRRDLGFGFEEIALITGQYRRLEATTPSQALQGPVLAHLRFVSSSFDGISTPDAERLCAVASEVAGLAGWLAMDMNDHIAARGHYESAIEHAERAGSDTLCAYMVGSMSFWASAAAHGDEAVRLAERAKSLIPKATLPAAQAWVAALDATAHASIGDTPASLEALERAETAVGRISEPPFWPWVYPFDPGKLATYRGACATRLKLPRVALPALHEALENLGPAGTKRRALVLCDMAQCHVLSGEIEEACRWAAEAFTIGVQKGSGRTIYRVREVWWQLARWKTTQAVTDLRDYLLGTLFLSS